jgi:hypothetical protein
MTLTKQPIAWVRDGAEWGTGRVIEYRIQGPSPDEEAFIANFGSHLHERWMTLQVKDGVSGEWQGNHTTADEAFTAVRESAFRV